MDLSNAEIEKMLISYEPLIRKLSYEYYRSSSSVSLEAEDFLQEVRIGFMKAVKSYEEKKGTAFSTYIENGIRIELRKLLSSHSRLIRFPKYKIEQLSALDKAEKKLGTADEDAISSYTGISREKITGLKALRRSAVSLSLDDEAVCGTYLDFIRCEDFSSSLVDNMMLVVLEAEIDSLDSEDAFIFKSLSGTYGEKKKSRLALSKELRRSYSSISSSYMKSLDKLRKAL